MNKRGSKIKPNIRWTLVFLGFVFLGGLLTNCMVQSEAESEKHLSPDSEGLVTLTIQPALETTTLYITEATVVTTVVVTEIPSPTKLPKIILTASPTIPATSSATPTPDAEGLRAKWQAIDSRMARVMSSNNNCELPCWWGIEPRGTLAEAQEVFRSLNENGWVDSPLQWGDLQQIGYFYHDYRDNQGDEIYVGISIKLLTDLISLRSLEVGVGRTSSASIGSTSYDRASEILLRDWEQYSVQNLLAALGKPSHIHFLPTNFADGDNFYYALGLYYPDIGIVAVYHFPLLGDFSEQQTTCLDFLTMTAMELHLFDPNVELPDSYLQAIYPLNPLATELSVDAAQLLDGSELQSRTNMGIDEFMNLVTDEDVTDCFAVFH